MLTFCSAAIAVANLHRVRKKTSWTFSTVA